MEVNEYYKNCIFFVKLYIFKSDKKKVLKIIKKFLNNFLKLFISSEKFILR